MATKELVREIQQARSMSMMDDRRTTSQPVDFVTPTLVFILCSSASLLLALVLWLEVRRTQLALPRMTLTTGVVRELESVLVDRSAGSVKSFTLVQVDFSVNGTSYCCRELRLFAGNRHVGDVRKKYDFLPGQQVGVYYDRANPQRSALILDQPRFDTVVITVLVAAIFGIMAAVAVK